MRNTFWISITIFLFTVVALNAQWMAFETTRDGNFEIYKCTLAGSQTSRLTNHSAMDYCPKVSPDRSKIGFISDRDGAHKIYTMNMDGSDVTKVSNSTTHGGQYGNGMGNFDWTPEGKIIFTKADKIRRMNSDGTNEIEIATAPSGRNYAKVVCSPTGNKIALYTMGGWAYHTEIYLANPDGSNVTLLVPNNPGAMVLSDFSRDGQKILYGYDVSGHEEGSGRSLDYRVFTIGIDGLGNVDLSSGKSAGKNDYPLTFNPCGNKIIYLYSSNIPGGRSDHYMMNNDGSSREKILEDGYDADCWDNENQAPSITVASPITLWPPNHQYESIAMNQLVSSVSDNCGGVAISDIVINKASSDEPENANGNGDGNTLNDIVIANDCKTIQLRSERDGNGNGRVYTIHLRLQDADGNTTNALAYVKVPHNQGSNAIDDGAASGYTVNSNCYIPKANEPAQSRNIASGYSLHQNFPNPFSATNHSSTEIGYRLPAREHVVITVRNMLGEEVATLIDATQDAGSYTTQWNGRNLSGFEVPSGMYIYQLRTGDVLLVKKLMLIR